MMKNIMNVAIKQNMESAGKKNPEKKSTCCTHSKCSRNPQQLILSETFSLLKFHLNCEPGLLLFS